MLERFTPNAEKVLKKLIFHTCEQLICKPTVFLIIKGKKSKVVSVLN
jgi:hypothetical protein